MRTCLAFSLVLAGSAVAMSQDHDEDHSPAISNVIENPAGTQITVNGMNFGTETPEVWLGTTVLTVTQSSATSVVVDLPGGLAAGANLLRLESEHPRRTRFFEAAIGQIGPVGATGQVWSANMALPASVPGTMLGSPTGLSTAPNYSSAQAAEGASVPVPDNCTASGFQVTVIGLPINRPQR